MHSPEHSPTVPLPDDAISASPSPSPLVRRNLSLPGALLGAIERRVLEVGRRTFSRYVIELVCYDLRNRHLHGLTGPLAHEPAEVQEAVDRAIDGHYVEGLRSNAERMDALVKGRLAEARSAPLPPGALAKVGWDVFFPSLHTDILEIRCRELRFECLSQYVTSVIRYDLLLGGPHKIFYNDHCTRAMCAALDVETRREFFAREQNPKKCLIDYVVERVAGREMSYPERHAQLRLASAQLTREAVAAQRRTRRSLGAAV
jgi:hypothetical protein